MVVTVASRDAHPRWVWWFGTGALASVALAAFGLPPINVHGPLHFVGIMGPTCGMTRAVRSFALGNYPAALRYNPAVIFLPALAGVVFARASIGRLTGRWIDLSVRWRSRQVALPLVAMLMVLTIRQQANVDLLGP